MNFPWHKTEKYSDKTNFKVVLLYIVANHEMEMANIATYQT